MNPNNQQQFAYSNPGYPPAAPSYMPGQPLPGGVQPFPGGVQPFPGGVQPDQGYSNPGYPPVAPSYGPGQPLPGGVPQMHSQDKDPNLPGVPEGTETAPNIADMKNLPGYEGLSFNPVASAPPPPEHVGGPPPERPAITNFPRMTEEDIREALGKFVSENCCYGKGAARDMVLKDFAYKSAFHYTLETFCEKRETAWAFCPYDGTPIPTGYAPGPWEIQINPPGSFKDGKAVMEVPNTGNIRPCHGCMALGQKRCSNCFGRGNSKCTWCHGHGRRHIGEQHERCTSCHGTGHQRCIRCHGHGHVTCDVCKGKTQLRYFVQLNVNWADHLGDHISDTEMLPRELIRDVTGQIAFEEQGYKVWPVTNFPDASVNTASDFLVSQHRNAFPLEKQLEQRHRVRIIPITVVDYSWKDQNGKFFVYGFENKVHFPEYPQQCCCGCTIL